MTRNEFMQELESGTRGMPESDRIEALRYYEEYFDEAGPENEIKAANELGDPAIIAKKLMADYAYNQTQMTEPPKPIKNTLYIKYMWLIILGICVSPIALPVVAAIMSVIFSIMVVLFVITFVFAVLAVVFIIVGAVGIAVGIAGLFASVYKGLIILGAALIFIGVGILMVTLFYCIVFKSIPQLTKLIGRLFKKLPNVKVGV